MRSDLERLHDILEFGAVAQQVASQGAAKLDQDVVSRLALERALFIVGEAAANLTEETRAVIHQPWTDIIGMRQVLAHHYQDVRIDRLKGIVHRHIPALLTAIHRHLAEKP